MITISFGIGGTSYGLPITKETRRAVVERLKEAYSIHTLYAAADVAENVWDILREAIDLKRHPPKCKTCGQVLNTGDACQTSIRS